MAEQNSGGRRRPTIRDVAKEAGVSIGIVSRVFRNAPGASQDTRERVRRIAKELGYEPDTRASLLRSNRANVLGVAFLVESAFHGDLLPGIYDEAEAGGFDVALSGWTSTRSEERAIQALLRFRCDALILLGTEIPESRIAELEARLPVVVAGRRLLHPVADTIHTDDEIGMRLAVEHLVELGHRAIAHVDGGENVKGVDRLRGYIDAMSAVGLAEGIRVIPGGQTVEAGAEAAHQLLRDGIPPTAVVAFDDDCAWGLVTTLAANGLSVPGGLSVVGFDGSRMSRLMPIAGLTTIQQDAAAIASLSVKRAVERVGNADLVPVETVLPPRLIVGSSTAVRLESASQSDA